MNLMKTVPEEKVELQIAPLIDVVFLLLIYFMVTTALIKKEADISFMLPAKVEQDEPLDLPMEITIEIAQGGQIMVEGVIFPASDRELLSLATRLTEFRQSAEMSGSELIVNIAPNDEVPHERIVDVMNACAIANVKNTSFTMDM
jgi:biopolymer transport protein ExbD